MTEPVDTSTVADIYRKIVVSHPETAPKCKTDPYVVYGLEELPIFDLFSMIRDRYKAVRATLRFGVDVASSSSWVAFHPPADAKLYSKFLIDAPAAGGVFLIELTSGSLDIEAVKDIARVCVCTTDAVYSNAHSDLTTMLDTIVGKAPLYELSFGPCTKVEDHIQPGVGCVIVSDRDLVELGKPEPKPPELTDTTSQSVKGDLQLHAHCECGANVYVPVNPLQLFGPIGTECGACGRHMTITYTNPN